MTRRRGIVAALLPVRLAFLSLIVLALAGCSKGSSGVPTGPASPAVLQANPADGATDVRLDAAVSLDFGVAVDTDAVENGFHLISEADMSDSCPDPTMPAHGSMNAVMADPAAMAHMDAYHATRGSFSWNETGSVCTFTPDSLMQPQTRYMMHMGRDMMEMMNRMGGSMGGGSRMGSGDMALHFRTIAADDHSGHHP